ncbi:hypothetical protein Slin15195_G016880 [Septoria linicola]|uniref:Uncharacterized protein n=1 Tax=Septoria linicola TaxID=215465 RepID=A0A9Q9AIF2_9PEZI|nr:hypothetical protein Slin14017_G016940 [Septoria linicola]USW48369.1 hypothetical protein Slin15195_G016880 [Septoria linicola]
MSNNKRNALSDIEDMLSLFRCSEMEFLELEFRIDEDLTGHPDLASLNNHLPLRRNIWYAVATSEPFRAMINGTRWGNERPPNFNERLYQENIILPMIKFKLHGEATASAVLRAAQRSPLKFTESELDASTSSSFSDSQATNNDDWTEEVLRKLKEKEQAEKRSQGPTPDTDRHQEQPNTLKGTGSSSASPSKGLADARRSRLEYTGTWVDEEQGGREANIGSGRRGNITIGHGLTELVGSEVLKELDKRLGPAVEKAMQEQKTTMQQDMAALLENARRKWRRELAKDFSDALSK